MYQVVRFQNINMENGDISWTTRIHTMLDNIITVTKLIASNGQLNELLFRHRSVLMF